MGNRICEIIIAGRPGAKGRVRFARKTGHAYTPERTVAYEGRVASAAQAVMNGRPPASGPVAVRLDVRLPIPASWPPKRHLAAELGYLRPTGKPDIDNYIKILDACNLIIWGDDAQVVEVSAFKRYSVTPGMTITVDRVEDIVYE